MSHRDRFAAVLGLLLPLLLVPALAGAGKWPHERDGWLLGLNLGGGTAGVNFSSVDTEREGGGAGNFRVGYAFQNQFAVGLEGSAWTKNENDQTVTFSFGGPAFTYYPGSQGFYVRGAIGAGTAKWEAESGGVTYSVSDTGFGAHGGMGYEFRLARKFALGPQVDFSYAKVNDDLSVNYWNFTVGGNWYF
jgi:hypothetical protein